MTEQRTAHDEFYKIYEPLRKKYHLSSHIRCTLLEQEEDYIEVFEGVGKDKKPLFKAKGDIEDCYKHVTLDLKRYREAKKGQ